MRYEIRKLKLGGVLDDAIKLTKNHFGAFFGVVAVTILPLGLVNAGGVTRLPPAGAVGFRRVLWVGLA
jgi:hypothetical protein